MLAQKADLWQLTMVNAGGLDGRASRGEMGGMSEAIAARPWLDELGREFIEGLEHAVETVNLHKDLQAVFVETSLALVAEIAAGLAKQLQSGGEATTGATSNEPVTWGRGQGNSPVVQELASTLAQSMEGETHYKRPLLYVRQSALVRAWASLEALAEDAWVRALNEAGPNLLRGAFGRPSGDYKNLHQKNLDFDFLVENGFNLQKRLGTCFAKTQSFKTVEGIQRAYKAAFGFTKKPPSFTSKENKDRLALVEAKRHVIVHRGGKIDCAFVDRTGTGVPGEPLELSVDEAVGDVNLILKEGIELLEQLAALLQELDPVLQSTSPPVDPKLLEALGFRTQPFQGVTGGSCPA